MIPKAELLFIGFILLLKTVGLIPLVDGDNLFYVMIITMVCTHLLVVYYLFNMPFTFFSGLLLVYGFYDLGEMLFLIGSNFAITAMQMGFLGYFLFGVSLILSKVRKTNTSMTEIIATFGIAALIIVQTGTLFVKGPNQFVGLISIPIILLVVLHVTNSKLRANLAIQEQKIMLLAVINNFGFALPALMNL